MPMSASNNALAMSDADFDTKAYCLGLAHNTSTQNSLMIDEKPNGTERTKNSETELVNQVLRSIDGKAFEQLTNQLTELYDNSHEK